MVTLSHLLLTRDWPSINYDSAHIYGSLFCSEPWWSDFLLWRPQIWVFLHKLFEIFHNSKPDFWNWSSQITKDKKHPEYEDFSAITLFSLSQVWCSNQTSILSIYNSLKHRVKKNCLKMFKMKNYMILFTFLYPNSSQHNRLLGEVRDYLSIGFNH